MNCEFCKTKLKWFDYKEYCLEGGYAGGEYFCPRCSETLPLPCKHKETIALNEEGNAGVYCVDCGSRLTTEA